LEKNGPDPAWPPRVGSAAFWGVSQRWCCKVTEPGARDAIHRFVNRGGPVRHWPRFPSRNDSSDQVWSQAGEPPHTEPLPAASPMARAILARARKGVGLRRDARMLICASLRARLTSALKPNFSVLHDLVSNAVEMRDPAGRGINAPSLLHEVSMAASRTGSSHGPQAASNVADAAGSSQQAPAS